MGSDFSKAARNQIKKNETVKIMKLYKNKQLSYGVYVFEETLQEKLQPKVIKVGNIKEVSPENDGNVIKLFNIPPKLHSLIQEYIDDSQGVLRNSVKLFMKSTEVLSYNSSSKSYKATDTYTNSAPRLVRVIIEK